MNSSYDLNAFQFSIKQTKKKIDFNSLLYTIGKKVPLIGSKTRC